MTHNSLDPEAELLYAARVAVNEFLYSGILDYMTMTPEEGQEFAYHIVVLFKTHYPHRWLEMLETAQQANKYR